MVRVSRAVRVRLSDRAVPDDDAEVRAQPSDATRATIDSRHPSTHRFQHQGRGRHLTLGLLGVSVMVAACGSSAERVCAMSVNSDNVLVDGVSLRPETARGPVPVEQRIRATASCGRTHVRTIAGVDRRVAVRSDTDRRLIYVRPSAIVAASPVLRRAIWKRDGGWSPATAGWRPINMTGRVRDTGENFVGMRLADGDVALVQIDGATRFSGRKRDGLPAGARGSKIQVVGVKAPRPRGDGVARIRAARITFG